MESEDFYKKQEHNEDFVKKGPLTKALSEAKLHETNLPDEIKTNPHLLKECGERKTLLQELDTIYANIPALTDIDAALEGGLVSNEETEKFYKKIVSLIEKDKESSRLLLYFPVELVPRPTNERLSFFSDFYKKIWKELLKEIDVREGFNIGDIPEKEIRIGSLAKVSKAAHLIPSLVEKGIISKDDIFDILKNENDETITESTIDTLRILADKKYLSSDDLDELNKTEKVGLRNMVKMIRYDQENPKKEDSDQRSEDLSIDDVFNKMNIEIQNAENSILDTDSISKTRSKWLISGEKDKIVDNYSEIILKRLEENQNDLDKILGEKDSTEENSIAIIKSLEKLIIKNPTNEKVYTALSKFKETTNTNIKNELLNTLNKLDSVDKLNEKYFSKDELEKEDVKIEKNIENKITNILSKIEGDPLLSNSIYPVAILYGSHIKGYGKENSDTDIAVFVKEDVSFDKHEEIKSVLNKTLEDLNINGSIMEFWLKKETDSIWIKDFENSDNSLGDGFITSPLTGVWYGDEKTLQTLQTELVPNYLYSENKKIAGVETRKVWLRDMEQSLIQYRLMHKGYKEKNLEQGGIDSAYRDEIDGKSMFYDSGFRRLATKIYLEKVFLPQLKK